LDGHNFAVRACICIEAGTTDAGVSSILVDKRLVDPPDSAAANL
jgi:hypothetical protein